MRINRDGNRNLVQALLGPGERVSRSSRIREQNRITVRRDDTAPCSVCCMPQIVNAQRNSG